MGDGRRLAGLPAADPPISDHLDLRKIRLERDRIEDEAVRAHARERNKLALQHDQEMASKEADFRRERLKMALAAEDALNKFFHEKIAEVSIGGVERGRDGAKFVQTAATAVFAVYTGLLALVYSVTENPLPLRGAWAGVFLGLAIAFATAYLAFLTDVRPPENRLDNRSLVQRQYSRTANLTKWVKASVHSRRYALRASVLSLLFGVLFIAAPFLSLGSRPLDIPEPVAPEAPTEVATGLEETARELFETQLRDYENAVAARAEALQEAQDAAADRAGEEERLNAAVSIAAGAGLVLVLIGPLLYSVLAWALTKPRKPPRGDVAAPPKRT